MAKHRIPLSKFLSRVLRHHPEAIGIVLQNVKRGVHKLLGLGIGEVHVVADHGFLLLEEIGEHEKASFRTVPTLAVHERYLLGRGLGKTEQVAFPVQGSGDLIAWYPL